MDVIDEYMSKELYFNGKQLHRLPKETGKKLRFKGKLCNSKTKRKFMPERESFFYLQVGLENVALNAV